MEIIKIPKKEGIIDSATGMLKFHLGLVLVFQKREKKIVQIQKLLEKK